MRLTRLDLLCYGAFADRGFSLRPDARLHVVYGANEAGKSSTLAAVRDLLFGFPARTGYDFRFKSNELRVGGEVVSRAGARLAFVRRKGLRNTLLDPQGKPLPDDALAPFLGQMTAEIFGNAFGLDAEALRKGAQDLLQAQGEVGSSLMAAASGLRGLTQLRRSLEEEADAIFTAHKSQNRRFYQARDRFEVARKEIGELELRAGVLKKLEDAITQGEARLASQRDEKRALGLRRARLARLKRLAPLLRRIDAQDGELAAFADLPEMPAGFVAELGAALDAARLTQADVARAQGECAQSAEALAAIGVDDRLLERATDIEALVQRIGEYAAGTRDLPRVAADHDGAHGELDRQARSLGLADAQALAQGLPSNSALALVRDLAQQGQALAQRRAGFEDSLAEEARELEMLDAERATQPHLVDPAPLRERLRALGSVETLVEAREQRARALRREEGALREEAMRLTPSVEDLAALATAPLPDADVLARFAQRLEELTVAERDGQRSRRDVEAEIETVRLRLEALVAGGEVPSRERIAAVRATRDAAWGALRPVHFGEPSALGGAALVAAVAGFEIAIAQADALADDAVRDAERVAAHAAQTATLASFQARLATLVEQGAALAGARAALKDEWLALWRPTGLTPLPPAQMGPWRVALRGLLERRIRLADLHDELARSDAELASLVMPLEAIARDAALPPMEGLDVARQAQRLTARLRDLAEAWDEARAQARRRDDIAARIDKLRRDLAEHEGRQEIWQRRWQAAVPNIGLPAEATPVEAAAALDIWKLVPAALDKRADFARRVEGMRRDLAHFEQDAQGLIAALCPDLATLAPAEAVERLSGRLAAARSAAARREEVAKRQQACDEALQQATRAQAEARARLAACVTHLPDGVGPAQMHERLARREALRLGAQDLRRQLADQGEGLGEAQIRTELADFDADRAEADIVELAAEEERLAGETNVTFADLAEARRQVTQRTQGVGSEIAWQQRVNAEAEMQEASREWIVLRLASTMLEDALERHRAGRQDPLMQRASTIFSDLTGGRFTGIDQSYDDNDVAVLTGRRDSGELVRLGGLSEGTRDQLYLALRLAYVEEYALRAEPAPFVADDLFTSFDDARTVRGLHALAGASAHLQCILFTHHRHVAELARSELGTMAEVVEL